MHYVFDILDATYQRNAPYFFIVGDSTVAIGIPKPGANLPFQLQEALRGAGLPTAKVVDLSHVGLHAEDALVLIAEAMTYSPALVIYDINPRVFGKMTERALLTADRAAALAGAGGSLEYLPFAYLIRRYGFDQLASSFVTSNFSLARFAPRVRGLLWELCGEHPGRRLGYVCDKLVRPPATEPPIQRPSAFSRYVSDRTQIDFDNPNTHAFEMLVDLCERTGRCLFYETPLNPECPIQFEPGIVDDAKAYLARVVDARVPLSDFSNAFGSDIFMEPMYRECDGLHLNDEGNRRLAARLADAVLRTVGARAPSAPGGRS